MIPTTNNCLWRGESEVLPEWGEGGVDGDDGGGGDNAAVVASDNGGGGDNDGDGAGDGGAGDYESEHDC